MSDEEGSDESQPHEPRPSRPEGAGSGDAPVRQAAEAARGPAARIAAFFANPAYRFVFFFLLYLAIVAVVYPPLRERYIQVIDAIAEGTAWIEYELFRFVSWVTSQPQNSVTLSDKVVVYQGFAVKIIEECTGIYEVLIFSAAVLAFPTTLAKKGIGLGIGVPLLYLFNVIRIALLIWVGRYLPEFFDFVHLYFMQATLILMITSVWLLWIIKVVRNERPVPAVGR